MTKKFSTLEPIVTPASGDLFAVSDTSAVESKRITFQDLKNSILDEADFDYGVLVSQLNAHNPSNDGKNGLYATRLYAPGSGSSGETDYQEGTYFLTYANLSGKPTIPTDLDNLNNTTGFLRYNANNNGSIEWLRDNNQSFPITTNYLSEGTNNLYYTEARAKASLEANFAEQFNIYNTTFDEGDVRDSVYGMSATFQNPQVAGQQTQSQKLRINSLPTSAVRQQFAVGQTIRIYGAQDQFVSLASATTLSVVTSGFIEGSGNTVPSGVKGNGAGAYKGTYSYKIAEFDLETGEISPASSAIDKIIYVPATGGGNSVATQFNVAHFVRLGFDGTPADKGIVVYRRIGTSGDYKLTAVLGRKDVASGNWIDYGTFDYTSWSGKNIVDNTFSSIIHFPLTAPSVARRGWTDKTISGITNNTNNFDLTLDNTVFVNSDVTAQICHNDTSLIQTAITNNALAGKKNITLNAKTYVTSQLQLPNTFGLVGTAYITKIRKLPWSGGAVGQNNSKFIVSQSTTGASSISIVGVDLDGEAANQFLWPDESIPQTNYLLDFGSNCNSLLIDRARITNAPAGGIWATSPVELKISTSEIVNSGVTDRYPYKALVADGGTDTMIVGNRFQNYSDNVDVSVTNKGIVANNVINNCGSGLFVYGSVFFVSSPNVLMGPAGEFLPTPDILNSEYDLINYDLTEARNSGASFVSTAGLVYQEDGAVFDLTKTDGVISDITHRAFYIQKTSSGVEEVYGTTTDVGNFVVTQNGAKLRYTILTLGGTTQGEWNTLAGTTNKVYRVGDTFNAITVGATSSGTPGTATTGGVDTIVLVNQNQTRSEGEFQFTIDAPTVTQIKDAGTVKSIGSFIVGRRYRITSVGTTTTQAHWNTAAGTSNVTYVAGMSFVAAAVGTSGDGAALENGGIHSYSELKSKNPLHVGIGWSSSYRHEVSAGTVTVTSDPWVADSSASSSASSGNPKYKVQITNPKYLFSGQRVRFFGHSGWGNNGNVIDGIVDEITGPETGEKTITIQFFGAGGGNDNNNKQGLSAGSGGTLNIIDSFVMAQGRII
jgi:hypothetical protein